MPTVACTNAAIAMLSSSRMGMSHTLTSRVSKNGWGRISHQTFLPLSTQFVLTSRLIKVSYSAQLAYTSGMLVRGKRSKTFDRYDLKPVLVPSQNGELEESARI